MDNEMINRLERILSARNNGILCGGSKLSTLDKEAWQKAFYKLCKNIKDRPNNSYIELSIFRQYTPIILYAYMALVEEAKDIAIYASRMENDCEDKSHKRWTKEEDEMLIDWVCNDELSITKISLSLGRTVPAIKTRLSYLVGVKRLSQKIAGKFIGEINGEETEASIVGTVYKE